MNKLIIFIIILPLCLSGWSASVYSSVKKGNKSFAEGNYEQALEFYKNAQVDDPDSPELHYNIGATLFKLGKYEDAAEELSKVTAPEDKALQQKAYYNNGVAKYKKGIENYQQQDLQGAIDWLEKSISSTEQAIELDEQDEDAKFNIEQAKKKLKEIKELMEQQQQQQQDSQDQQDENQDEQEKQEKDQQKNNDEQKEDEQEQEQNKQNQEDKEEQQQQNNQKEDKQEQKDEQQQKQNEQEQQSKEEQQQQQMQMSKEDAERLLQMLSDEDEEKQMIFGAVEQGGSTDPDKDW